MEWPLPLRGRRLQRCEGTDLARTEIFNLADQLTSNARRWPASPALLAPGRAPITHAQLGAAASRAGPWLAAAGLNRAARIAVLMPPGPDLALACLAMACAAACLPLPMALSEPELDAVLGDAEVDAILSLPGDRLTTRLARARGLRQLSFEPREWQDAAPDPQAELAAPEPGSTAFILLTSGTTGRPKRVPLTHRQLMLSATNIAQHLQLTPEDRSLGVMSPCHSHGLVGGLLAPLAAGASVVCTPHFEARAFLRWLRDFEPTWYSAAPTLHLAVADLLARQGAAAPPHRLRLIRSASSALPAELQQRLEALWQVPVIQTYGMTETATQLASNPLPPGARKPGSVGRAVGAELRIVDRQGAPLPAGRTGAVQARGPTVFGGYEGGDDPGGETFIDGWFATGDLGWLDDEGYLFLAGRSKEMVNRGGEKISPFDVEQALLRLPGVAQAAAYAVPHPTLGEDLQAAVVAAPDAVLQGPALRTALFGVVADFKVPASIHVLPRLPTDPGGKVRRRDLHQQIAALLAPPPSGAPMTALQASVAALFAQVLDQQVAGAEENFLALGGDSLSAAQLILAANALWGLDLPPSALLAAPTVAGFAAAVRNAIDQADTLSAELQAELEGLSDEDAARLLGESPAPG